MYRRFAGSLPKDPYFPADLLQLGYFINEKDQIRSCDNPEQRFHYFISKNDRYVEMQREAMNECIRQNVLSRLQKIMTVASIPLNTALDQPYVPVLVSKNILFAKRIIVYIGESSQDLGILAGRLIDHESIAAGSAINFVNDAHALLEDRSVAVVVANPGQLVWYRRGKKAMTLQSWNAIQRETEVSPTMMLGFHNRVPGQENVGQHIRKVFEEVVGKLSDVNAKISVIGIQDSVEDILEYLQNNWKFWAKRIDAVVIGSSHLHDMEFTDEVFQKFWSDRARAYLLSPEPIMSPLAGRKRFGCNCFSSGEQLYAECIMTRAYGVFLDYFKLVAQNPDYVNVPQKIVDPLEASDTDWSNWEDIEPKGTTRDNSKNCGDSVHSDETIGPLPITKDKRAASVVLGIEEDNALIRSRANSATNSVIDLVDDPNEKTSLAFAQKLIDLHKTTTTIPENRRMLEELRSEIERTEVLGDNTNLIQLAIAGVEAEIDKVEEIAKKVGDLSVKELAEQIGLPTDHTPPPPF